MPTPAHELARAFEAVVGDILSRKDKRKLLRAMEQYLHTHIPENGIGPVLGARKEALQIILSAERSCEERERREG